MGKKADGKVLAQNKKASHDYFIEDTYEAGLVLTGTEIKSLRNEAALILEMLLLRSAMVRFRFTTCISALLNKVTVPILPIPHAHVNC